MDIKSFAKYLRGFFNVNEGRARYKTIRKRIRDGAKIDGIHLCQLIAAMVIASIGLNVNSTEAIIGAMLICPLMGSVLAIAYSVATIDLRFLKETLMGLVVQTVICLITSTLYFALSPLSNATSELLTNSTATLWDVLIAFVGGFAGAIGNSRREEPTTLIAGVAVATALMPPLCSTGYGFAAHDLVLALSAFYEFLINVVFIAFGAELVLVWLRLPLQRDLDGDGIVTDEENSRAFELSLNMRRRLVVGSLLFALPCLFYSARVVHASIEQNGTVFEVHDTYDTQYTTYELKAVCPDLVSYRIGDEDTYDTESDALVQQTVATIVTTTELSDAKRAELEALVRLNVEELDGITFETLDDLPQAAQTQDS